MTEIKFAATVDHVTYTLDSYSEVDVASFHVSRSDIGFVGTFEQFSYSNNIIFDNFDAFLHLAPPATAFEPFDVIITIKPNDGNPYVYNDNIIVVEVI